jgi:single-strand DNA-binding protein
MFNKILLQGNLTRDPAFAQHGGQGDIVNFTVASTRKYKQKEETVFIDCTAYGKTATNIGRFFHKGDPIGVEGRLSMSTWEDQSGKRKKVYVTVDGFHFVGKTGQNQNQGQGGGDQNYGGQNQSGYGNQGQGQQQGYNNQAPPQQGQQGQYQGPPQGQGGQAYNDDIPF